MERNAQNLVEPETQAPLQGVDAEYSHVVVLTSWDRNFRTWR
jgi:hypothetical protein